MSRRRKSWLGDRVQHQSQDEKPETEDDAEETGKRPCVGWIPIRCHYCGSKHKSTDGVNGRYRYHTCKDCNRKFNSYEMDQGDA